MRLTALIGALCAASLAGATPRTAHIYIQSVETAGKPSPLAEIAYDVRSPSTSEVLTYEAPDLADGTETVRVGVYDVKSKSWSSGTTVASADNFGKGFSPNFLVSVDASGEVLSTALKGVQIDAGHTRDFGPKVVLLPEERGTQPALNKPVVLNPEGKREEIQEKTLLQKYERPFHHWFLLDTNTVFAGTGGLVPLCCSWLSAAVDRRNRRVYLIEMIYGVHFDELVFDYVECGVISCG